jgi:hypothetical protein
VCRFVAILRANLHLGEDALHNVRLFHAGEFAIEPAEGVRESLVVDAQDVKHRGVQVAEDRIFGDVVAEIVGAADTYRAE